MPLIKAEEYRIIRANVRNMVKSDNPDIRRIFGSEEGNDIGKDLGLSRDWIIKVIRNVGNYGEIFERNIRQDTPLKIESGINDLWSRGGLQYGIHIR